MKAIETPTSPIRPAAAAAQPSEAPRPAPDVLASWLLEGRFFTIGPTGAITSWSSSAADAFGWRRTEVVGEPFVDTLLAPEARAVHGKRLVDLLADDVGEGSGFTGEVDALDAEGRALRAAFAIVPIQLGVGYEFNSLLQTIASRGDAEAASVAEAKARHEVALSLIERALDGGAGGSAGGSAEGNRVAGALVVFSAGGAAAASAQPVADNVVSIGDAAGLEEARAQLERARRDADEGRVEIRNLEGQLEEARREAQRSRNEADVARQDAADARDSLIVAQRGAEEARRQLEDSRRTIDEVRGAAEAARIRSEEAQRESDSLRAQLREARESVRGLAGRADDELAQAQEHAVLAERELANARAAAARHEAEVAPLRERYQAAQRELGSLRADLESAQAAAVERETVGDRRAGELERTRAELDARTAEAAALRDELEARTAEAAAARDELEARVAEPDAAPTAPDHELVALRERVERMRTAFDRAPVGGALIAPDGRYLEVSDSLCEALGHPSELLLSAEAPAILHPDDAGAHLDLFRRMLAGEQAGARGYRRYLHADGHTLTMRECVSLVRDAEGRPSMFVVQLEEAHAGEAGPAAVVDAEVAAEEALPATPSERERSGAVTTAQMRHALEDELFQLYCQPVLDLRTSEVTQHELLIRMTTEDGRLVLPQAFLGPARRAGLAHAIDRWVVRQAIRLLHETALAGHEVNLEVNLSPEAVHDHDLPAMIEEELAATPVDPARLVLEVTGATAAGNLEETRALAKRLRGLGCRFALDDFRSSFGSFRLLRDLPLDYLKLDGELVASLAESRTSQLIVKALVDVAAGAGMKTVAVFVSDAETLRMLREMGVDYAQGYAVGRPSPVREALPVTDTPRLPPG